jgi:PAS domain S-box-containing protein
MQTLPWHILIIEDSEDDCADLRQMLLRAGRRRYRFSEARSGAEGVRKLLGGEGGPFDCVLLDYCLPDMDAHRVLAALCNGADLPPYPVVVITGTDINVGQALLSAGAQDFIGKRWTGPESLTRAVENAVDRYALQTERLRAEAALRTSEERYRALFNSIDAGYAVVEMTFDGDGTAVDARYLQVNPAFERQSGLADAQGRTLRELVPDIEALWLETFGAVALTGVPVRLEQYVQGLQRWFDVYAFRLGDAQARQVAMLFTDTTERKRIEMVLSKAKADADAGSQAKTDFLLRMSHELRSPLSSILGFTQLIDSGTPPPTPAQRDSVDQILHAGWYLLGLINEILDLSSIEAGKTMVMSQAILISELLDESQAMIGPQALASGIQLGFPHLEIPHRVLADPIRTKQVLVNLLTNAIKYNRANGRVDLRCSLMPGPSVRISVDDTGPGLSPAQIAQLFEPFNRLGQESGTGPTAGTGIGLTICKRLVELMGGRMGVDSQVGVGSSFWFELAAAADPPANKTPPPVRMPSHPAGA